MKTKLIIFILLFSLVGIFAQQKAKVQKPDESGFIEVDEVPVLISKIKPSYPEIARLAGIEGTVYLKVLVDENGNVVKTKVEQGAKEILDNSALQAAQKAKFSPAMLNNKPVKVWVVLPIAFKLDVDKKDYGKLMRYDELGPPLSNAKVGDPDMNEFILVEKYPELIESVKPEYPEIAKRAGITGKVFVKVLVDKNGSPKKAIVIKSDSELFNPSAVDAAMKSKFTPAINNGEAIAVWIVLPYKFSLGEKEKGDSEIFESVDEATKNYKKWVYASESPDYVISMGGPADIKIERVDENISVGDEHVIIKVTTKYKIYYGVIVRKGNAVYRYNAPTLDEVKKYVEELNKKFQ